MQTFSSRRRKVAAVFILAPLSLLITGPHSSTELTARAGVRRSLVADDADRAARHASIKTRLSSTQAQDFRQALKALASLDEQGALYVWESALAHPDPELRKEAWVAFQASKLELTRKELVPQVARIAGPANEILDLARASGLEANVWSATDNQTIIAAPPYLLERLSRAGLEVTTLYDSVADWQRARASGDKSAESITPDYQSATGASQTLVRVAVVDLVQKGQPAAGYSSWLGDHENILMRSDAWLAYLDVFTSDGSVESIDSHVDQQYTKRGHKVLGFYTLEQFAQLAPRLFPGRTFDPGRARERRQNEINPALLEGRFHSYEETLAEFTELAQANPNIARFVNLGLTYEGRQIFALKITRDPAINDSTKPEVLVTGCHHAREWISVEPPVFFAKQLINGYGSSDSMKYIVDNLQIWIVPIVNPDGLTFSQGQQNDVTDGVRLWRKNRRPISVDGCGSGVGADLNRNYDFQWRLRGDDPCPMYSDDMGGSDDPKNEVYRGPRAGSELEVKAIKSLVDDPQHHFRAELDYHNYSQLILYPWGYQTDSAPDAANLAQLGQRMSDEIFKVNQVRYKSQQAISLYETTGASVDYSYGANSIPASYTVEMRPTCCNFNVPENEISQVNEENWAGARLLLDWAAGPPILVSVKAYQRAPDGTTTKLVYAAHWQKSAGTEGGRQFVVDTRFPGLEPGRMILQLQFSKSMPTGVDPHAVLGRTAPPDELRVVAADQTQGWQRTAYSGDTWVGEVLIPQDADQINPWLLAVAAADANGFKLDALPATVAGYATGTNSWLNYEDSNNAGSEGGTDTVHALAPTLRGDSLEVFVASPSGGERLAGGELYTVTWRVPRETGFVPVGQDLLFSADGGVNFSPIVRGISGAVEKFALNLPRVSTTTARIRLVARDATTGNVVFGDNKTNFTIAANVGSGVEISFVSSERVDLNWAEAPSDDLPGGASGTSRLIINVNIVNKSGVPIANPFVRVNELTGGNVLLTRDSKSTPVSGARQSVDTGGDDIIAPGETVPSRLIVGLANRKKLAVNVDFYGVPVGGSIIASSPVRIWKGKPKTK
ncbi:MAG TPA: M14 family metallopeptidase [Blastocatellia bacterium]|nr:M14 family metallopeptidase [Blastocatellia bacterium]